MDMSRVSACSYPFRDRPWTEALSLIRQAGFTRVDLLGRAPHLVPDPAETDLTALRSFARRNALQIANLGTYVGRGFASGDQTVCEQEFLSLRRCVDVAVQLGARSIRVMPGDDQPASIPSIAAWFRRGAEYAEHQRTYLAFETHGGAISGDPARCVELCEAVGHPHFGVLFDPCNLMHGGMDYRMALWTMREHVVHVHLKDAAVGQDGFHLTMLGEGQLDFAWIVAMLDGWGYAGDYALEYELADPPAEAGLSRWFEAARSL